MASLSLSFPFQRSRRSASRLRVLLAHLSPEPLPPAAATERSFETFAGDLRGPRAQAGPGRRSDSPVGRAEPTLSLLAAPACQNLARLIWPGYWRCCDFAWNNARENCDLVGQWACSLKSQMTAGHPRRKHPEILASCFSPLFSRCRTTASPAVRRARRARNTYVMYVRVRACVGASRRDDPPRLGRALFGHAGMLCTSTVRLGLGRPRI